jgi:hypothetical protein
MMRVAIFFALLVAVVLAAPLAIEAQTQAPRRLSEPGFLMALLSDLLTSIYTGLPMFLQTTFLSLLSMFGLGDLVVAPIPPAAP